MNKGYFIRGHGEPILPMRFKNSAIKYTHIARRQQYCIARGRNMEVSDIYGHCWPLLSSAISIVICLVSRETSSSVAVYTSNAQKQFLAKAAHHDERSVP